MSDTAERAREALKRGTSEPTLAPLLSEYEAQAKRLDQLDMVLRLLQGDPHQWSRRPCSTCQTISSIAGRAFGCSVIRAAQADKKRILQGYADAVSVLGHFEVVDADPPYLDAGETHYIVSPSGGLAEADKQEES